MRKWWMILCVPSLLGTIPVCYAACPTRVNTYVAGTVISPTDVLANENALFTGIQNGLSTDCIADNAITTAKIATGGVTSADILDGTITTADLAFSISGGTLLPAGAVYFMLSGSCPAGTTDVSATYANLFLRVNATAGTTGGVDSHTHTAGTYAGSVHTHSGTTGDELATRGGHGQVDGSEATLPHQHNFTTGSGGGGVISGTSASGTNVPSFVTAKLCKVN